MSPPSEALAHVFGTALPELFARITLPDELAHGALMFVATPRKATPSLPERAWLLHAPAGGGAGAEFRPCPPEADARCRVVMAEQDFIALGHKTLHLEMAFMQGRLKVHGDMACAMQLGALFG